MRNHEPFGRGPYTRVSAEFTPAFAEKLLGYCRKLDEVTRNQAPEKLRPAGESAFQKSESALARLARGGLIETDDGFVRLTPRGMELHNAVVLELLEDTEA